MPATSDRNVHNILKFTHIVRHVICDAWFNFGTEQFTGKKNLNVTFNKKLQKLGLKLSKERSEYV